jgi:hypothetical protein
MALRRARRGHLAQTHVSKPSAIQPALDVAMSARRTRKHGYRAQCIAAPQTRPEVK